MAASIDPKVAKAIGSKPVTRADVAAAYAKVHGADKASWQAEFNRDIGRLRRTGQLVTRGGAPAASRGRAAAGGGEWDKAARETLEDIKKVDPGLHAAILEQAGGGRRRAPASGRGASGRGRRAAAEAAPRPRRGGGGTRGGRKMGVEAARKKLEDIRKVNPALADLLEQEAEIRHAIHHEQDKHIAHGGKRMVSGGDSLVVGLSEDEAAKSMIRPGSVGGVVLDVSIVVGTGFVLSRLDDMIQARPLGLSPSDFALIVEALVLGYAMWKRHRKVARFTADALAGTAGMKLARAVRGGGTSGAPPAP